jgi:phosphoribosylaminoimidazole-succinocarboxamide synthase
LIDAGYDGNGAPPTLAAAVWEATSHRYIDAFERLTGQTFQPGSYPVDDRIREVLGHAA